MLAAILLSARQVVLRGDEAQETCAVQPCGEVVGYLDGREIYAAVQYMGLRYRFECAIAAHDAHALRSGELFVEPGLLYLRDAAASSFSTSCM
jgi:hypothetical protein